MSFTANYHAVVLVGNIADRPTVSAADPLPVGAMYLAQDIARISFVSQLLQWVDDGSEVTLYVSTTGSDSNPGTPLSPLLTVDTAVSRVPSGGTIHFAPGTYPSTETDLIFDKNVTLIGSFANVLSGTITGTAGQSVTDGALALAPNSQVGRVLRFTDGAAVDTSYLIRANTPTQLTLLADAMLFPAPAPGDHFVVEQNAVSITTLGNMTLRTSSISVTMLGIGIVVAGTLALEASTIIFCEFSSFTAAALLLNQGASFLPQGLGLVAPGAGRSIGTLSYYAGAFLNVGAVQMDQHCNVYGSFIGRSTPLFFLDGSSAQVVAFDTDQTITLQRGARFACGGGGPCLIDGAGIGIDIQAGGRLDVQGFGQLTIQNCTGDAVRIRDGQASVANVVGTGNAGFGWDVNSGSRLTYTKSNTTLTGALGDFTIGTLGVKAYAAVNAVAAVPDFVAATSQGDVVVAV